MASQQTLSAEKRDVSGSTAAKRLRREGIVPAVVYGSKQRAYTIQVNAKEFGDLLKKHSSSNFLVNLEIEGADEKTKMAMVQDLQQDPLSGSIVHVDFHAVNENETIHAVIPIALHGEAAGVKNGGLLEHLVHSIEIHCRPANLPEEIVHDVSDVEIGQSVSIGELNLPEGVSATLEDDVIVVICNESRAALSEGGEDEEGIGEGPSEPEVINEKPATDD